MKNIERAEKKYSFRDLDILANLNLVNDIKEMFDGIMDERIAEGKMPAENKGKAAATIDKYLDYIWEQETNVAYHTLCELYDYLANSDLTSSLWMVQEKRLATCIA